MGVRGSREAWAAAWTTEPPRWLQQLNPVPAQRDFSPPDRLRRPPFSLPLAHPVEQFGPPPLRGAAGDSQTTLPAPQLLPPLLRRAASDSNLGTRAPETGWRSRRRPRAPVRHHIPCRLGRRSTQRSTYASHRRPEAAKSPPERFL